MPPKKKSKAGRKPLDEKEKSSLLGIYVKNAEIDLVGGKDEGREILLTAWKAAVKKKKK